MKKYMKMLLKILALFLIITLCPPQIFSHAKADKNTKPENQQSFSTIRTQADADKITKYGNILLNISYDELKAHGYDYGDIVKVKIFGKKYRMPIVSNYSDVDVGSPALVIRAEENGILLAINFGDFATQYNIATKTINEDKSFSWSFTNGSSAPAKVSIWMKKQGGYREQLMLHRLEISYERNDYPNLYDEEFANFREVKTTGIGDGILYRTSSPVDPDMGRNKYVDEALKKYKINTILNLTDDEINLGNYENFDETYYSTTNYKCIGLSLDFYSDDFKNRLADGLRFLAENPGTYAIHCKEGKNRVGFSIALLECLMGASLDEVKQDYMTTYYNYYGVTAEDERYESILNSNLVNVLKKAFTFKKKDKNKDLGSRNLAKCAEKYLLKIGLTKEEIKKLKKNLAGSKNNNTVKEYTDVAVLSTTDMHGRCWDTSLLTGLAEHNNMLRVSTAVKEIGDEFGKNNVILIDNGDLFQGTPVSQTQLFEYSKGKSDLPLAMAVCLKEIQYDAFELGNHEFNYDWATMSNVYKWLNKCGVEVLAANANYKNNENNAGANAFTPYIIKEIEVNGNTHKIGILGLENSDISRWDIPANYPDIQFVHPGNVEYSMSYEAELYIPQMLNEGCEFIIVSYHGGLGDTELPLEFGLNSETQGKRLIEETENIDLLITGHDHTSAYSNTYVKNKNGEDVLVVNGGGTGLTQSVFRFKENSDGKLQWEIISSENKLIEQYDVDMALEKLMKPYVELAELDVEKTIGVIVGEWDDNSEYFISQTDSLDLVNKALIEVCSKELKQKYDEKGIKKLKKAKGLDHIDIDLAISTVVTIDNYVVEPGDICVKDIYKLYKYANNILVLPISGRDIRLILEENASERLSCEIIDGKAYYSPINDNYTHLIFGGLNFSYNMAKPAGERVSIRGFSNGRKFDEDSVYLVAVNNYILGNIKCGLRKFSVDDAIWSQIEDKQGEIVQDIISEYIISETEKKGGVSSDSFNWKWDIIYSDDNEV